MNVEITVRRIGGLDNYPRRFGPVIVPTTLSGRDMWTLDSDVTASLHLRLTISDWGWVSKEWLSCNLMLEDINGYILGRRPVEVYAKPYDMASHAHFSPRHPDAGAFSVGLRVVSP